MKTSELIGPALDWAVAKCEGILQNKPDRCFDCTHHEERAAQYCSQHLCWHPKATFDSWYSEDVSFSTDYETHPSCPLPYPAPYSTDWAQGGPIIEREGIDVQQVFGGGCEGSLSHPVGWQAQRHTAGGTINPKRHIAQTPLIAAMRCYCCTKLGDEVEIPQELQQAIAAAK